MTGKKRRSSGFSLLKFFAFIPQVMGMFRGILEKVKIETYLTIKNLIILLMLTLTLACLLAATWVSLMAILFFALIQCQWTWYAAASTVMLLNVILLIFIGISISKIRNNIISRFE